MCDFYIDITIWGYKLLYEGLACASGYQRDWDSSNDIKKNVRFTRFLELP